MPIVGAASRAGAPGGGASSARAKRMVKLNRRDDAARHTRPHHRQEHQQTHNSRIARAPVPRPRAARRARRTARSDTRAPRRARHVSSRAADVDHRRVDEVRPERGLEVVERARENDARATSWKRRLDEPARPLALRVHTIAGVRAPLTARGHGAGRHAQAGADDSTTISRARRSTSRAFAYEMRHSASSNCVHGRP